MALRAVIFDYGVVLSGPADAHSHAELVRLTGLSKERFEQLYWTDRPAYDMGALNGDTYWQKFFADAGLPFDIRVIEDLNYWDARLWGNENSAMVAWQAQLKLAGLRTAILSNMGDVILAHILKVHKHWIHRFDALVWSFQVGLVKPNPAIYRLTLDRLGTAPEETLFIDDKMPNIEAARALGICALRYSTTGQLRDDLCRMALENELPLPG